MADKSNHCVRIIYLTSFVTATYAGKCGSPGFMDGPFGDSIKLSYKFTFYSRKSNYQLYYDKLRSIIIEELFN